MARDGPRRAAGLSLPRGACALDWVVGIEHRPGQVQAMACSVEGLPGGQVVLPYPPGLLQDDALLAELVARAAGAALAASRAHPGSGRVVAACLALPPGEAFGADDLRQALSDWLPAGAPLTVTDTLLASLEAASGGGWGVLLEVTRGQAAAVARSPEGATALRVGPSVSVDERWLMAATKGDADARRRVEAQTLRLARLAIEVARQLPWPAAAPLPLFLGGDGHLQDPGWVACLRSCLGRLPAAPPWRLQPALLGPPAGALLAAARLAKAPVGLLAGRLAAHRLAVSSYGL